MSQGHYFDTGPLVPSRPDEVELVLPDFRARLRVDRGVFSAAGVDPGTLQLLRATPPPPQEGDLLDLGCGYGPIACTLAHRAPNATIWAVDVNERALALATQNARVWDWIRSGRSDRTTCRTPSASPGSGPILRSGSARSRCTTFCARGWAAWTRAGSRGWWSSGTWGLTRGGLAPRRRLERDPHGLEAWLPGPRGDAAVNQLGSADLHRLHQEWKLRTPGRVALLLDGVRCPRNVGAIVHAAAAYGVDHLYLGGDSVPPSDPQAERAAMGLEPNLSWSFFERGRDAADAAREDGYVVVGLELADDAVPLHRLRAGPDVCLAVGHEDRGLGPATMAACDAVTFLPQVGGGRRSLSVATAASIALYELRRQAWA